MTGFRRLRSSNFQSTGDKKKSPVDLSLCGKGSQNDNRTAYHLPKGI